MMQKAIAHDRNYIGKGRFSKAAGVSCVAGLKVGKTPAACCHFVSKPKILGLFQGTTQLEKNTLLGDITTVTEGSRMFWSALRSAQSHLNQDAILWGKLLEQEVIFKEI